MEGEGETRMERSDEGAVEGRVEGRNDTGVAAVASSMANVGEAG